MTDATAPLVSLSVLANAQAERERNARIYGPATGQRLAYEAMLLSDINVIHNAVNPHDGFTPRLALAQELGRLAVGVLYAEDILCVCERAIAQLADFAAGVEDERAEKAQLEEKVKAEAKRAHDVATAEAQRQLLAAAE